MNKLTLGLTPSHFWLRERVLMCIEALERLKNSEDWDEYKKYALIFSEELNYCLKEWDKYYE